MVTRAEPVIDPELRLDRTAGVEPGETRRVDAEPIVLVAETPDRWLSSTHLRGVLTSHAGQRGTPAPFALDPESVVVTREDVELVAGVDYVLDAMWGGIGGAREPGPASVSYRYGLRRVDTIAVDLDGVEHVLRGESHLTTPHPPVLPDGWKATAHVFVPYFAGADDIEMLAIGDGVDDVPRPSGPALTAATTLAEGRPLRITFWGDSVTVGGDASSAGTAFPGATASLLRGSGTAEAVHHDVVAVSGSTSRDWFRQERDGCAWSLVEATGPDLVVAEFVNDAGLPADEWTALYEEMRDKVSALGAELLLTTPHWTLPEWMPGVEDDGRDHRPFVAFLREFARDNAIPLADVSAGWEALRGRGIPYVTLLNNGINHPDDRGHALAARIIAARISEVAPA